MSSKHFHHELGKFVYDLGHLSIDSGKDSIDEVWGKITNDIQEYEKFEEYKWLDDYIPEQSFSLEQSDRPDIIYQCEGFIMGIECFEFDASKKGRRGSTQRQKEREVDRKIHEEYRHSSVPENGFLSIERNVDVDFSITSYYESLVSTFKSHADSIIGYRNNLTEKAPGKKVLLSFFIEDVTALGNYVIVNGKTESLNPLKIPFFLGELASIQGLDYIIFKTMDSYVPSLYIQKLSKPLLAELLKKCYGPNDKYVQYQYKRESHYWG